MHSGGVERICSRHIMWTDGSAGGPARCRERSGKRYGQGLVSSQVGRGWKGQIEVWKQVSKSGEIKAGRAARPCQRSHRCCCIERKMQSETVHAESDCGETD